MQTRIAAKLFLTAIITTIFLQATAVARAAESKPGWEAEWKRTLESAKKEGAVEEAKKEIAVARDVRGRQAEINELCEAFSITARSFTTAVGARRRSRFASELSTQRAMAKSERYRIKSLCATPQLRLPDGILYNGFESRK